MKIKRIIRIIPLILLFVSPALSQDENSLDWYVQNAQKTIDSENYKSAIDILEQGKTIYSAKDSAVLNQMLADLYYDKKLYNLALREYLAADGKNPGDTYILDKIGDSYGRLDKNQEAIAYYEKIFDHSPDDLNTMDWLGWMYYKVHKLAEAEKILLKAVEIHGLNNSLALTLGMVYSDLWQYDKSRNYYLKSVELARKNDYIHSASIAYYDLALHELGFYNYYNALDSANNAILMEDRPSGHNIKGDILLSKMDYKNSQFEYKLAEAMDTETPLAKINLAVLYQIFGKLEIARAYLENVLLSEDSSWMFYFGTDTDRQVRDLHEIQRDLYQGLANQEFLLPKPGVLEELASLFTAALYWLKYFYHNQMYKIYSIKVGQAYYENNKLLDAYWSFYQANKEYKDMALKYINNCREIKTRFAPHSEIFYMYEEGLIRESEELLEEALQQFDPYWEKEVIADALLEMILLYNKKGLTNKSRLAANRLYEINPGAFLQNGIGLALELDVNISRPGEKYCLYCLWQALNKAACPTTLENNDETYRYRLSINWNGEDKALIGLYDKNKNKRIKEKQINTTGDNLNTRCINLVRNILLDFLYVVD